MKSILFILFLLFSIGKGYSQTYEVRKVDDSYRPKPINYGKTISTTDVADRTGDVQTKLQTRYDSNYQKVNSKISNISKILKKLRLRHEDGTQPYTDYQRNYLIEYAKNFKKIEEINLTHNSTVQQVLSYLDEVETELFSWL